MEKNVQLSKDDEIYIEQLESWVKEQGARERQIKVTIETSSEIVRQNEIQLELCRERTSVALDEYDVWREEKGLPLVERKWSNIS